MPRRATYHVQWSSQAHRYEIQLDYTPSPDLPIPDSPAWFDWLEEMGSFAFSSQAGPHCTVLKERVQRGGMYWYGYRSRDGRTIKRYLGRTKDLSLARLEEVAALLADGLPAHQGKEMTRSQPEPAHQSTHSSPMAVLASKLHPPHLPVTLIERARLFARLETALSLPLTLIAAPAGFGKTTLVTQWIAEHRTEDTFPAVGWVSLDANENDLLRFWRYVITACQAQLPSVGAGALALLSSPPSSPLTIPSWETILTLLLNDLAQLQHLQFLVLDDYHVIVEPAVHETLTFFLDHLPTRLHVLLLSRAEPPFPLLHWRARGHLGELHMTDLRFSSEETGTFLRQAVPALSPNAPLTQLDAVLEGWPAGLRLLSLTLQGLRTTQEVEAFLRSLSPHADPFAPPALPRSLLDYLVIEILHAQPEPLQHFLRYACGGASACFFSD